MIKGERFSQVYLEKSLPLKDSVRMRNRISANYWESLESDKTEIIRIIEKETGAKTHCNLPHFFENCEIRDLLDSITLIYKYFNFGRGIYNQRQAAAWHQLIGRIFKEENIGYSLDKNGGVHYFIDEEFEKNRAATIAGLSSQPAVQESFNKAYTFLDQDKPDTASAVRAVFESIEILYKHIISAEGKERLNSIGVQKNLKPIYQKKLVDKITELKATEHILDGLCDWIDAGHMYRHGQKLEKTEEPTIEFTVLYISQGASYLRFLLQ